MESLIIFALCIAWAIGIGYRAQIRGRSFAWGGWSMVSIVLGFLILGPVFSLLIPLAFTLLLLLLPPLQQPQAPPAKDKRWDALRSTPMPIQEPPTPVRPTVSRRRYR
jgi:hypothetical protein